MIQFISFVFGTLNLAQLQFWEDVAAVPQLSCDKKNVKIFTNKVGSEKKNTNQNCSNYLLSKNIFEFCTKVLKELGVIALNSKIF